MIRRLIRRILPARARRRLALVLRSMSPDASSSALVRGAANADYQQRLQSEQQTFATQLNVHDLPAIFHYWSNRYLRPINEGFGFSHPEEFFEVSIERQAQLVAAAGRGTTRIVSLGSGNCDAEVRVAKNLRERGVHDFVIECVDINPAMLERGTRLAQESGVGVNVRTALGDFNDWRPNGLYDVVLANQSLHHVTELERLFERTGEAIGDTGIFVTSDMIGRNGHMRWPEALAIVHEFWRELPKSYRFNRQLHRHEELYENWDCSVEGFEGIRAQDILPLLVENFGFEMFLAYGNVVDPFIDRGFGHNFDADAEWDRAFIDRVHARDEAEILAGSIKPTHMMAVMCNDRSVETRVWKHLTPSFCVRPVDRAA